MSDAIPAQKLIAVPAAPNSPPASAAEEHNPLSLLGSGEAQKGPNEPIRSSTVNDPEHSAAANSFAQRLRQKTDSFDFDALLSPALSLDDRVNDPPAGPMLERGDSAAQPDGASPQAAPTAQQTTPLRDSIPSLSADVTARLVEQLTRTNERLEKLEATIREVSLLYALQREPEKMVAADRSTDLADNDARVTGAVAQGVASADPTQEAEAHFRRGVALCQASRYDEAIAAWEQVLRLQPENAFALANIGIVLTEQARWSEAHRMFTRVLALQPDNAEAHYGLGMAYAQLGDYSAACIAWENTLRLRPDNADARYNLALVKKRLRLDNIGARSSAQAAPNDAAATQGGPAPLSSLPAEPAPVPARDTVQSPVLMQAAQPAVTNDVRSAPDSVQRPVTENVSATVNSSLKASAPRANHMIRNGLISTVAVAVVGCLVYFRSRPPHSIIDPTAGNSADQGLKNPGGPPAKATPSLSPTPPSMSTAAKPPVPSAPRAGAQTLAGRPGKGQPRPGNMQAGHNSPSQFGAVQYHVRPRSGSRVSHRASQSTLSRRRQDVSSAGHTDQGYNQGIDRLLDHMP